MRDEMCLTDDLYTGCFTVITPAERNYCCKQKLASHKCICIHLTWCRAWWRCLWQLVISLSARVALTAIHGKTKRINWGKKVLRQGSPSGMMAESSSSLMTWACTRDVPDSDFCRLNLIWLFIIKRYDFSFLFFFPYRLSASQYQPMWVTCTHILIYFLVICDVKTSDFHTKKVKWSNSVTPAHSSEIPVLQAVSPLAGCWQRWQLKSQSQWTVWQNGMH